MSSANLPEANDAAESSRVIYSERQWVPWYWWILGAGIVALTTAQLAHNRNIWWAIVPAIVLGAVAAWLLWWWSSTTVSVEVDDDGTRWLVVGSASLPDDVVARSMAVPASAKRNAMGRQLDPAAFVVSHGWVPEMIIVVLDDPEDPTPYWLIASKHPEALLDAFLPDRQHHRAQA